MKVQYILMISYLAVSSCALIALATMLATEQPARPIRVTCESVEETNSQGIQPVIPKIFNHHSTY